MFKRKPEPTKAPKPEENVVYGGAPKPPDKTEEQLAAERIIERGERTKALSNESAMWRAFATGCKGGRWLYEDAMSGFVYRERPPRLSLTMDDDTAKLWADFAIRMAEDRESRLRDLLRA